MLNAYFSHFLSATLFAHPEPYLYSIPPYPQG